jgi:phosphodiesterase/alkaline phosphatase D-like protein
MAELSRRELLQLSAAGLLLRGCGDNGSAGPAAAAVLEPSADALMVAVWAQRARSATVELRDPSDTLVASQIVALGDSGSALVDVGALAPATRYAVTVTTSEGSRFEHVATTAPADTDPRAVRIAVVADADTVPENATDLCDQVIAAAPELTVAIGDFPYTDNGPPAMTLAEYRARHVEFRTHPPFRRLLEAAPLRAIYDDHEFRNNWDAKFVAAEPDRYAAAMTSWDEFYPVRGATGDVRYRNFRWGANVECFLLDCRRFRSADADPDMPGKTMLGATQRAWIVDALHASTATFKLVFTSVPLDFSTGDDAWSSFTAERDPLLDALLGIHGLVFLTADQHFFAAHRHAHGIREFQIGPLARGLGTPGPDAPGVMFRAVTFNAGILDIDADHFKITGLAPGGKVLYTETITAGALTPT